MPPLRLLMLSWVGSGFWVGTIAIVISNACLHSPSPSIVKGAVPELEALWAEWNDEQNMGPSPLSN